MDRSDRCLGNIRLMRALLGRLILAYIVCSHTHIKTPGFRRTRPGHPPSVSPMPVGPVLVAVLNVRQPIGSGRIMVDTHKANLGNAVEVSQTAYVVNQYGMNGAEGNFAEVFDTTDECSKDGQLRIFNIVTYIQGFTPRADNGSRLALLGKLSFGIGGGTTEVDFDWKVGNQISVAASFARLSVAFSEIGVATAPNKVRVGAMLSSGSRAARAQNTRTFPQLGFTSASVVLFPVPPFAHALNLFSTVPAFYNAGAVQIRYVGAATAGASASSGALASWISDGVPFRNALANEDGVRIPEAARWVEITGITALTEFTVTPCFTLSI